MVTRKQIVRYQQLLCTLTGVLFGIAAYSCSKPNNTGPRQVEFVYWNRSAKNVFLAGNFNGWNTSSTPMHAAGKGEWQVQVALKPGRYQYKFIADGHWTQDPATNDSAPDLFGGKNSVITVNP